MKIFGWDLGCKRSNIDGARLLPSYTLAEVVIVMLVIAVVVAVSIRITKAKLDSIVSYTYYSAYSTLKGVTRSLLSDFDKDDEDYMAMLKTNLSSFSFNIFPKAEAVGSTETVYYRCGGESLVNYKGLYQPSSDFEVCTDQFSLDLYSDKSRLECRECKFTSQIKSGELKMCPGNFLVHGAPPREYSMYAPDEEFSSAFPMFYGTRLFYSFDKASEYKCNNSCYIWLDNYGDTTYKPQDFVDTHNCGSFYIHADCSSSFAGSYGSMTEREFVEDAGYLSHGGYCRYGFIQEVPEPECNNPRPSKIPCDKIWDDSPEVCGLVDKPGFSDACPVNQEYDYDSCSCKPKTSNVCNRVPPNPIPCGKVWDNSPEVCGLVDVPHDCSEDEEWSESACDCVPSSKTVPRKGINFCEQFEARANTKSGETFCHGDDIATSLTDFSSKKPDMVLRNGMLLYNMHKDPEEIDALIGNTPGGSFGDIPNTNSYGYTVYVDIDGKKGESKLWEDVYPFYITLSGKVIPAYSNSVNPDGDGGNNKFYLQTSVEKTKITADGKRQVTWPVKSVSFKESACKSGYVGTATPYCSGVVVDNLCLDSASTCKLKIVAPIKFF